MTPVVLAFATCPYVSWRRISSHPNWSVCLCAAAFFDSVHAASQSNLKQKEGTVIRTSSSRYQHQSIGSVSRPHHRTYSRRCGVLRACARYRCVTSCVVVLLFPRRCPSIASARVPARQHACRTEGRKKKMGRGTRGWNVLSSAAHLYTASPLFSPQEGHVCFRVETSHTMPHRTVDEGMRGGGSGVGSHLILMPSSTSLSCLPSSSSSSSSLCFTIFGFTLTLMIQAVSAAAYEGWIEREERTAWMVRTETEQGERGCMGKAAI
jgi:hypothetical protein